MQDAVARLFTSVGLQAAWFSPLFLAAVPLEQVQTIRDQIVATLGAYQGIAANGNGFTVRFARGTVQATGALDASGAFSGLLFSRMQSDAAEQRLTALFATDPIPADWFSATFLAQVPVERTRAVVAALTNEYGAFERATPAADGTYTVDLAKGDLACLIFLDPEQRIVGLIFRPTHAS